MVDATHHGEGDGQTRREFLYLAAGAIGAVGAAGVAWSLVDSMNPAADTLALSSIDARTRSFVAEGTAEKIRALNDALNVAIDEKEEPTPGSAFRPTPDRGRAEVIQQARHCRRAPPVRLARILSHRLSPNPGEHPEGP